MPKISWEEAHRIMPREVADALESWLWKTGVFFRDGTEIKHLVEEIEILEGRVICYWVIRQTGERGTREILVNVQPPDLVLKYLRERV